MKYVILLFGMVLGFSLSSSGQETEGSRLIRKFYKSVYNKDIEPSEIVSEYIEYSDTAGNNGYRDAVNNITGFRYPTDGKDGFFSLLKMDIVGNNFSIQHYSSFSDIEKAKFNDLKDNLKDNVYKLSPTHTIPVYVLLKGGKIASFFGFKKAGSDAYTFIVYH